MYRKICVFLLPAVLMLSCLGQAQDSLGDAARKIREQKDAGTPAQTNVANQETLITDQQSVATAAKKFNATRKLDVVVSEEDAKDLFKEMNSILHFASEDTGMALHTQVKHKLASRDEVDKKMAASIAEDDNRKRLERAEVVLKKFGMLPANFDLGKFYAENEGASLAGFYDFHEKTMYLLNWIDLDEQRPVMAHELTHALQDQNFNLSKWSKLDPAAQKDTNPLEDDTEPEARRAAIEGQAMIVFLDYLIQPLGRRLATTTESIDALTGELMGVYESPVEVHAAPLLLKETTYFPYFDGFAFELELLKREGTQGAFAGVFARPPRNTHEIMHPDEYLSRTHQAIFHLPDVAGSLPNYKLYDSGTIGELDVRIMVKTFGRENDAYSVSPQWDGGGYEALLKPSAASKSEGQVAPDDLALVYVSKWKSYKAAQRFADLYRTGLLRRSHATGTTAATECDAAKKCATKWAAHFDTDQGPVVMEIAGDNTVVITQGLEDSAVSQVRQTLARPKHSNGVAGPELSLRFGEAPEVQALREQVLDRMLRNAAKQ